MSAQGWCGGMELNEEDRVLVSGRQQDFLGGLLTLYLRNTSRQVPCHFILLCRMHFVPTKAGGFLVEYL